MPDPPFRRRDVLRATTGTVVGCLGITPATSSENPSLSDFDVDQRASGGTEIEDWHDLSAIRDTLDTDYVLVNDLDERTPGYDEHVADPDGGWEPIGDWQYTEDEGYTGAFTGTFDGNGHEIRQLQVARPDQEYVGLFAGSTGTVTDVTLVDLDVTGRDKVGGLIGRNNGEVRCVSVSGNVTGTRSVGGLAGFSNESVVKESSAHVAVTGETSVGGLLGFSSSQDVENTFVNGDITGDELVGGLIGWHEGGAVSNSFAAGDLSLEAESLGGLIGRLGRSSDPGIDLRAEISRAYWDTTTTEKDDAVGEIRDSGVPVDIGDAVSGLTTDQMHAERARDTMSALDFEQTWEVTDGYPTLQWRETGTDSSQPGVVGRIVDVHGDPVVDTVVQVFDVENRAVLDIAETDAEGRFEFPELDDQRNDETLLVAKKPIKDTVAGQPVIRHWFRTRVYGGEGRSQFELSGDLGTIPLDCEEIFPPEAPTDGTGEPLGMTTIWRFVGNEYHQRFAGFSEPTEQIYYIEVTNTNRNGPLGESGHDRHEISSNWKYDLSSGLFSLTLPEDGTEVGYGSQSSADLGRTVTIWGAETDLDTDLTTNWHPDRTEIPAFESCSSLDGNPYEELSTTDAGAEGADRIEEGYGRIFGTFPIIGDFLEIGDLVTWAVGDALELSGEITSDVNASRTNPNTYDTVTLGWESTTPEPNYEESSVVLSVPLRFTDTEDAAFLGQAEYRHVDDRYGGVKHGNGLVRIPFSRGPTGHIGGED